MRCLNASGPGKGFIPLFLIIASLALAGCARVPVHKVSLISSLRTRLSPSAIATVALVPFSGNVSCPLVLGKRIRLDGKPEQIVLSSNDPLGDLTHIMWDYLEGRGLKVKPLPPGYGNAQKLLAQTSPDVLFAISPRLEALEVQATSNLLSTKIQYHIRISARMAKWGKKEIVERTIELNPKRTTPLFKAKEVERELNEQIKDAFSHLLKGLLPVSSQSKNG